MQSTTSATRASPAWPHDESYEDFPRGTLKSGKEAEIFLVERRYASGSRLLAHKRYRPRYPRKGQLRAEGFSNSTAYRGDSIYKAGWFLPTRDKKAVMGGSRYGHELAFRLWPMQEWAMLRRAWDSGASVPFPVEQTELGLVANLRALTSAGLVHADLSAYNLLWWEGRLIVIDLPQAVEFTTNTDAFDLLHRDVANVGDWFGRRGVPIDVEGVYAELVSLAWLG